MTPQELKARLEAGTPPFIVDVREPEEFEICNIGGKLIPLSDLPSRYQELNPEAEVVVLCHHGVRSAHAVGFLRQMGFTNTHNLSGGIDRWAIEIDPEMKRY